jgi:hypothetical protein
MLRDLEPSQRRLADFMSELSEAACCAGWMEGLEFALWESLLGERTGYGSLVVTDACRARLRRLSEDCGGWVIFDDETEETWLALGDWQVRFDLWKATSAGGGGRDASLSFGANMPSRWQHPKNDGFSDVDYDFGLPDADRRALASTLNEACHVFRMHADGHWASVYKDRFAGALAAHISAHPGLPHRLLRSGDRVIAMVTHRALELLNERNAGAAPDAAQPGAPGEGDVRDPRRG